LLYFYNHKKIHDTGVNPGTSWKKILKVYLKKLDTERKKTEAISLSAISIVFLPDLK
jgi:hypothetical protein